MRTVAEPPRTAENLSSARSSVTAGTVVPSTVSSAPATDRPSESRTLIESTPTGGGACVRDLRGDTANTAATRSNVATRVVDIPRARSARRETVIIVMAVPSPRDLKADRLPRCSSSPSRKRNLSGTDRPRRHRSAMALCSSRPRTCANRHPSRLPVSILQHDRRAATSSCVPRDNETLLGA